MRTVAILQSNYIPWKGYFDLIHDVDVFVFYDDVQYTKNDWRNRNRIKTHQGASWLTIPVGNHLDRRICDIELRDSSWQSKHWKSICQFYAKAPFFSFYRDYFAELYLERRWRTLSELNQCFIRSISCKYLGIATEFVDSRSLPATGSRTGRLLEMIHALGGTRYVSGPAARCYLEEDEFVSQRIELTYKNYAGYPEYSQLFPPFEHAVSILDLLFNAGPQATEYIWKWRDSLVQSSRP